MTESEIHGITDELAEVRALIKEHQSQQGITHCADTLAQRLRTVMGEYETTTASALRCAKEFRDRMLIDLRAFSMVVEMASNASTHREKNSRLRGCIELLESAIKRLEREQFDIACCRHPSFDDCFRSDYPTRHYVERIQELQRELALLKHAEESNNGR